MEEYKGKGKGKLQGQGQAGIGTGKQKEKWEEEQKEKEKGEEEQKQKEEKNIQPTWSSSGCLILGQCYKTFFFKTFQVHPTKLISWPYSPTID